MIINGETGQVKSAGFHRFELTEYYAKFAAVQQRVDWLDRA